LLSHADSYRGINFTNLALFFYNIFLLLYRAGICIASLWNQKARFWINGRKDIFDRLKPELGPNNSALIWFHCSSLGEFEQGRPVMETLKSQFPNSKLLLTFFSPSGFEIRKDYKGADWVFYLPLDSKKNSKQFFDAVKPSLVVFVKYDYWYHYLTESKKRNIPLLMISAIFRNEQPFFRWFGGLQRKMLDCFTHFFVQDKESADLLASIDVKNVTIAGDTRFDRVSEIAEHFEPIEAIEKFCGGSHVLVAGSTWPDDEKTIKEAMVDLRDLKLIIAPHEIHEKHLQDLRSLFPDGVLFSELTTHRSPPIPLNCLLIDNIGMLSRLYYYATITYVGGGFNNGIHNTLEAAVYGKPVLFGPHYKKFREAAGLIETGGGISIASGNELATNLNKMLTDKKELETRGRSSLEFVKQNRGATGKILNYIEVNRLLTS
jgi:3-deoxy-D-manno-octulosonic-acid transferase